MQLATQQPWGASIPRPGSDSPPTSAQLLIHSSMHAAPSTAGCRTAHAGLAWQQHTCVAAAIGDKLHFWKWTAQADRDPPFVGKMGPELVTEIPDPGNEGGVMFMGSPGMDDMLMYPPEEVARRAACRTARTAGAAAQHSFSSSQYSHTAAVRVLVQVPTGGPLPG